MDAPLPERDVRSVNKMRTKGREFNMAMDIVGYVIQDFILDIGSDVNIMPKKAWELMGKLCLVWSPIQLRLANLYKIYLVGRVQDVEVNNDGVKMTYDFEKINW